MNTNNNLLIVKDFINTAKSVLFKLMLKKILAKGGLDSVYDYIENFEMKILGQISTDKLEYRLITIDLVLMNMKDQKERLGLYYRLFTHFGEYENLKSTMEAEKNGNKN